jgi:glucose-1-phosphate thymidylyltransferase
VSGYWKDTGRPEDMLETNCKVHESLEPANHGTVDAQSVITGRVLLEAGATVVRSTIRGPAVIGHNTRLVDASVGPFTSIYHHCVVERSEIEHSLVLERVTLRDAGRIEHSLIGRDVVVSSLGAAGVAHRLLLGDHSQVSLAPQEP